MKHEMNRVLGRTGARELTPEEVVKVSGGRGALSATTNVATAFNASSQDVPETDDIDS
jgi:hypothetical protein